MKKISFFLALGILAVGLAFFSPAAHAGTSTRCTTNSDCSILGEVCSSAGNCVYPGNSSCNASSQPGSGCCTNDYQCGYGAACVNYACTSVACTTASGYAPGYSCGTGYTCNNPGATNAQCVALPPASAVAGSDSSSSLPPSGNGQVSCILNGAPSYCGVGLACIDQGTALETCAPPPTATGLPAGFTCPNAGTVPYYYGNQYACVSVYPITGCTEGSVCTVNGSNNTSTCSSGGTCLPVGCDSATDFTNAACQPTLHGQFQNGGTITPGEGWLLTNVNSNEGYPTSTATGCATENVGIWVWTGPGPVPASCPPNLTNPAGTSQFYSPSNEGTTPEGQTIVQSGPSTYVATGTPFASNPNAQSLINQGVDNGILPAFSTGLKLIPPTTPPPPSNNTSSQAIAGVQGYNSANGVYSNNEALVGTELVLYGTFPNDMSSGFSVSIDGASVPLNSASLPKVIYASSAQINIQLGAASPAVGFHTVSISWGEGNISSASFQITSYAPAPSVVTSTILTAVQGYDPSTNSYTSDIATINTQLVLYGNFDASGDTVMIDNSSVTPSYESKTQINIPLTGVAVGSYEVTVTTSAGSGSLQFEVAPSGPLNVVGSGSAGGSSGLLPASGIPLSGISGECSGSGSLLPSGSFPVTLLVDVATLNVRSAASTRASLAGSQTLSLDDTFVATSEVQGECVTATENGATVTTNLWWVSQFGNYVWSGGTTISAGASTGTTGAGISGGNTYVSTKPGSKIQSTSPAGLTAPVTQQINDSAGNPYTVTFTYLPDGESRASFTYSDGTQYIVQDDEIGLVTSSGSIQINSDQYYYNRYGGSGSSNFFALVSNIVSAMPANEVLAPGIKFSTSPNTAPGTYLVSGLYPATITTDADGNILSVQSVAASGYGSGIAWYNLGGGYSITAAGTPGYYYLQYSGENDGLSDTAFVVQNVSIAAGVTGQISTLTNTEISQSGYASLTQPSNPVTFLITATSPSKTISASGLVVTDFTNVNSGQLVAAVTENQQMIGLVNAGGAAAYNYIIKKNLSGATVATVSGGVYQVTNSSGSVVATFNADGTQGANSGLVGPTMTIAQLDAAIFQAVGFNAEVAVAQNAGYVVELDNDSSGNMSAIIRDPQTNAVVGSITQQP